MTMDEATYSGAKKMRDVWENRMTRKIFHSPKALIRNGW